MNDPRLARLADVLLDHSCRLKPGEKVLIEAFDLPEPTLVCRLIEGATQRGAVPVVDWKSNTVLRSLYRHATAENMALTGEFERARMEKMNAYIGVRGAANGNQFADVPTERMDLYMQHWAPAFQRVPKTAGGAALSDRFDGPGGGHEHRRLY